MFNASHVAETMKEAHQFGFKVNNKLWPLVGPLFDMTVAVVVTIPTTATKESLSFC